jgi:hypothetical protein
MGNGGQHAQVVFQRMFGNTALMLVAHNQHEFLVGIRAAEQADRDAGKERS